jgi:ribose/xylose/arabinose/galactoside ABC-type transport system permease subunit
MSVIDDRSAPPPPDIRPRFNAAELIARLGPIVGLVFVFALFSAMRPEKFPTAKNVQIMLLQTAVVATAALGMTMVIVSGGIDLSVGSNIALCSVAAAMMVASGHSPLEAGLVGLLAGATCGLVIGLLITSLGLPPFIVTLGAWGAVRGAAKGFAGDTMVLAPPTWLNKILSLRVVGKGGWPLVPPGVWLMLVLAIVISAVLRYTRFGRHIFAIGSNEQTARLCGVPVVRTKIMIYVLAGALAGIAGIMQFSYLTMGDPTTATGLELDIIAAVVIGGASLTGGQGTIIGTIIGSLIMTAVANGCVKMNWNNWVQQIVTGCIIIVACALDRWRHAVE